MRQRQDLGLATTLLECISQGADANAQDARGFTPLMAAALRNDVIAAETLLKHGASPYLENQVSLG